MHPPADPSLQFKFQWLNADGQPQGVFRKKGRFDGEALVLDDVQVPAAVIANVQQREGRMIVSAFGGDGNMAHLAFALSAADAQRLKAALDIARSAAWAEWHKQSLETKGRGHTYRDDRCPHCGATILLSSMPRSAQLYCHFCNTLSTVHPPQDAVPGEERLRLCDDCGMFSQPRKFTIFYFYMLIVVYGWNSRTTWRCPACMRGDAWKMLFGNLPFVLGVPVALTQLSRSYAGNVVGGAFNGLDRANLKARKGDLRGALDGYRRILERVPHSAGVKYNLGLALAKQGDTARAAETFQLALDDCSNYVPAYQMLSRCCEELGDTARLAELKAMWEDGGDEAEEEPAEAPATSELHE
ncbi:MAG TPA: tetratricopeptide repeat protein [Planctomycetaceae bacterium]|nr:tetratricopeptide repeat protein [Planctomycetaceae bacterium]